MPGVVDGVVTTSQTGRGDDGAAFYVGVWTRDVDGAVFQCGAGDGGAGAGVHGSGYYGSFAADRRGYGVVRSWSIGLGDHDAGPLARSIVSSLPTLIRGGGDALE